MAKRQPDLRKLAARQRWLLWIVAAQLMVSAMPYFVMYALPATPVADLAMLVMTGLQLASAIAVLVVGVLVMSADGTHTAMIVVVAILLLAPCANLLVLLFLNRGATRRLKTAGIRVGFMGANQDDVERAVNFELCKGCGYNLTGNTSGVCPECGQAVGHVVSAPPVV